MKKKKTKEEAEIALQDIINSFNKGEYFKGINHICNRYFFKELAKSKTSFLDEILSYEPITIQRVWHIVNSSTKIPSCIECGNEVTFISLRKGYSKTCSYDCGYGEQRTLKTKQTNIEKYGFENVFQIDLIKDKSKKTKLERYGDEEYNNPKKNKETCLEKYGFSSPAKNNEIKEKTKKTCLEKYGFNSPAGNEFIREKMKKTTFEKYGVENYNKTEESKIKKVKTNLERYGVEYITQNTEIFNKAQKSGFKRREYIMPSGEIIKIQGYENHTLDLLLKTHKEEDLVIRDKEIEGFIGKIWYIGEDNKKHRYFPDLYCISENKIYETKSEYTFLKEYNENILKMDATQEINVDFVFYIFNTKHELLNEQELIQKKKPE